jgi:hypothetical protein
MLRKTPWAFSRLKFSNLIPSEVTADKGLKECASGITKYAIGSIRASMDGLAGLAGVGCKYDEYYYALCRSGFPHCDASHLVSS